MICYPYVHSFGPNFIIFRKHGNIPVGLHILALLEWLWLRWGVPRWNTVNRPLPSSKNPRFQNEARCTTFLVKMSDRKMISISKAEHLPSFWNRGPGELGNGLLALDLISSFKPELCLFRYLFSAKAEQPAIMMMMMMMMMMIIAFLQYRKLLLTHYRNKKITDL